MYGFRVPAFAIASIAIMAGCHRENGSLQAAASALGAADLNSIEFTATGHSFQYGQAPVLDEPWPQFDVSCYIATINYDKSAARVQITSIQNVELGRKRTIPIEQTSDQYVSGTLAWSFAPPAGAPAAAPLTTRSQPAEVEERTAEIWSTPQGFLKAAVANHAQSVQVDRMTEVSFSSGKYRFVGKINARNEVERVQTWIDNPVVGDTQILTLFFDYKDFGGILFPAHIKRAHSGYSVLDLNISSVIPNVAADIRVPKEVIGVSSPAVTVGFEPLASRNKHIQQKVPD